MLKLWPAAAVLLGVVLIVLWRRGIPPLTFAVAALLGVYVILVLDRVLFPIPISAERSMGLWSVNLIPFHVTDGFMRRVALRQIAQNAVLTMPFGFLLPFLVPLRWRDVVWLAPAVGIGLEAAQLTMILLVGSFYRSIDITDAMMNTLGVVLGYAIFVGARHYTEHLQIEGVSD